MISSVTNRGRLNFMVFKKYFQTEVFLEFFKRLVRQAKGKEFLIVDRHPVHHSRKVKMRLERNVQHIRMCFLPSYSPELNPDELLNQDVKGNSVGRQRARNQQELLSNVRRYLRSRHSQPHIVRQYFYGKHVQYAAM